MSGAAHRQNVVFLHDRNLQEEGSRGGQHLDDGRFEVGAFSDGAYGDVVCFRNLLVVGVHHGGERIAMAEEQGLPLAHVAQIIIVEQNDFHGSALLHDGAKLFDGHLQTAISNEKTDGAVWGAEGGSDGGGKSEPHRSHSARGDNTAALRELEIAC